MNVSALNLGRIVREINPCWSLQRIRALGGRAYMLVVSAGEQGTDRLTLLTHSQGDRERNPYIARHEYRLLKLLREVGLPVADALLLCESHNPPFLMTSFEAGSACFKPESVSAFCKTLAATLHAVHAADLRQHDLSFLPRPVDYVAADQSLHSADQKRMLAAMQSVSPPADFNPPALLHGDFWPGNLLWVGDDLAAIIDWEDAMLGDPLADLGKSRLEVLWAFGHEAMQVFTEHYLTLNQSLDARGLPFWDLWGAFRLPHYETFASDRADLPRMRAQYAAFVEEAICRLDTL